ncbi:uncharacterized protein DSM5745_10813 [Aspergillus mulundensis]|uniref:Uncharacterized protein n=1 Tax=Aspergillus mulundensis TaxID=1810919 RepID=A0A3D8QEV2_9EURO|nr:hypothetical protein DSM5745_10813 [Aspergillus mulundensis]RDW60355.1 hypothetical protein DSM5745_10813 [Aspergillus mulundensis]
MAGGRSPAVETDRDSRPKRIRTLTPGGADLAAAAAAKKKADLAAAAAAKKKADIAAAVAAKKKPTKNSSRDKRLNTTFQTPSERQYHEHESESPGRSQQSESESESLRRFQLHERREAASTTSNTSPAEESSENGTPAETGTPEGTEDEPEIPQTEMDGPVDEEADLATIIPSPPRMPRIKHPRALQHEEEFVARWNALMHRLRWLYFIQFHYNAGLDVIIRKELTLTDEKSFGFTNAFSRCRDACRNWKSRTLKRMLNHVRSMKIKTRAEQPAVSYLDLTGNSPQVKQKLVDHFFKAFSAPVFFQIWYWLRDLIDYDKSSEYGQFFIKYIYAHLAAEMKLYDDLCDAGDRTSVAAWEELLNFWNHLATDKEYADLDKGCFKELPFSERPSKKRKRKDIPPPATKYFPTALPKKTSEPTAEKY